MINFFIKDIYICYNFKPEYLISHKFSIFVMSFIFNYNYINTINGKNGITINGKNYQEHRGE